MIDPSDRAAPLTQEMGRFVPNGRFGLERHPTVELKCKQVQKVLWAQRVRQPDASERNRAGMSASD